MASPIARREHDVIVSHELSRLWRSESEMHAIKEELEYLNVHVVTDDGIERFQGIRTRLARCSVSSSMERTD
jgi:DNA invertase Pin-like site-specific DNA recombinase